MLEIGSVVKSIAGRDKNILLAVVGIDSNRIYLCDGKERPLERAKVKNVKHIEPTQTVLTDKQMATNRELRCVLRRIAATDA